MVLFSSAKRSGMFNRRSVGSVICSVTRSPIRSAEMTPAGVSKAILRLRTAASTPPKATAVARWRFGVYLFHREENCFSSSRGPWANNAYVLRGRLQRVDPRADQTDAGGRPLFCVALRQDPLAIFGAF